MGAEQKLALAALAAWMVGPGEARAGGTDTTGDGGSSSESSAGGSSSESSESDGSTGAADETSATATAGTESTGTTESGADDESEAETGPCLSILPPDESDDCSCDSNRTRPGAAALGLLPLLLARRRMRREVLARFEGRLPADVIARLRDRED